MSIERSFEAEADIVVEEDSTCSEGADENDYAKYDHLNEMLDRLSKTADEDEYPLPRAKNAIEATSSVNATNNPPPKKRLFNDNDYTQMMNVMMVYDDNDVFENAAIDLKKPYEEEVDEEDFVELGESFAMNYWHNALDDMREDEDEEISEQLNRRVHSYDEVNTL